MIKVTDIEGVETHINPDCVIKSRKVHDQENKWTGYQITLSDGYEVWLDLEQHGRFLAQFEMKARR